MHLDKIEIDLSSEEQQILKEIEALQSKMNDVDPKKLNGQLMDAIQRKAIETITMALGVSDILENTGHTKAIKFKQEFENKKQWDNTPLTERSHKYKPKYTSGDEFEKLLNQEIPKYNRKDYVGKGNGLSQAETQREKWLASQEDGGVHDALTGKFIANGETDKKSKAYEWDHFKSAHEVHNDPVLSLLSLEEKRNFLNSDENLVPILGKLNNHKRAVTLSNLPKWLNAPSKEDPNKTNKEFFQIDEKRINDALEKSNRKENDILKNKTIVYSLGTQSKIAVSNAAKSGAKAAIGKLLSITVIEVINECKSEEDVDFTTKAKNITSRIKVKANDILRSFKDHSINSFLSTFVDALLNSVFKIAKNIFKFVKTAFMSIIKAVKILFSNDYTWEERLNEAMKIMGATVATLIGLALDEIIEKALITYLPFTAPFAGFISPVLSGLIVGISSVLILQGFQKYQSQIAFKKLVGQEADELTRLSKVNMAQAGVSDFKTTQAVGVSITVFQGVLPIISSCKNQINESIRDLSEMKSEFILKANRIDNSQDEADYLLNQLTSL
ncbi:hypothetical protein [Gelidibacter gilvus]|uniref:Uncharacterized protein n=1 Tax=Gelidibacter gilvus TaxID=59602 RepID=A0A4Q0XKF4_9FLAO|nr:hypothetical protein [Gelidibacter gilvus]RXJ51107.1 hypothetical protein ESZ48_04315 [Gelidibacter gilvus]